VSCEDVKEELCSSLKGYFSQISESNSKVFVQIDMKLVFNYVIWWNKWLGEELITEKKLKLNWYMMCRTNWSTI
jgi:hypothetical protein